MENKTEQILQGLNFSKNMLNSISIVGIENCNKLTLAYKNIDVFLNMLSSGEITIIENTQSDKEKE